MRIMEVKRRRLLKCWDIFVAMTFRLIASQNDHAISRKVRKKGRPPATLLNALTNDLKSMNLTFEQITEMNKPEYRILIEYNSE